MASSGGGGGVDVQVGQLVAVAVEGRGEMAGPTADGRPSRRCSSTCRRSPRCRCRWCRSPGRRPVRSRSRYWPHSPCCPRGSAEGGGVAGRVGLAVGRSAAVQVPAHGVELGQVLHLYQPVVVCVVVDAGGRRARPGSAQVALVGADADVGPDGLRRGEGRCRGQGWLDVAATAAHWLQVELSALHWTTYERSPDAPDGLSQPIV